MKTVDKIEALKHKKKALIKAASKVEGEMVLVYALKALAIQNDIDALLIADASIKAEKKPLS